MKASRVFSRSCSIFFQSTGWLFTEIWKFSEDFVSDSIVLEYFAVFEVVNNGTNCRGCGSFEILTRGSRLRRCSISEYDPPQTLREMGSGALIFEIFKYYIMFISKLVLMYFQLYLPFLTPKFTTYWVIFLSFDTWG